MEILQHKLTGYSEILLEKYHKNRLRIVREISKKHAIQVNVMASIQFRLGTSQKVILMFFSCFLSG